MKNKILLLVFTVFILSFSLVSASEEYANAPAIGDPIHERVMDNLDFMSKFTPSFSVLTTIGGALCSDYPDEGATVMPSVNSFCRKNINHIGEAYQLFAVNNDGSYSYKGEKQIPKGQIGCFDVNIGQKYHWDVYYCDNVLRSCTSYYTECHTYDKELRVRTCTDTGREELWINGRTFDGLKAPVCSGTTPPVGTGTGTGTGTTPPPPPEEFSMFIGTPKVSDNEIIDGDFVTITQEFKATKTGNYMLEAGIERWGGLSSVLVSANKCNPDDLHFANNFIYLTSGVHTITFKVTPVEGQGTYIYHTAHVSDCGGQIYQQVNAQDKVRVLSAGENGGAEDEEESKFPTMLSVIIIILFIGGYLIIKK